MGLMAHHAPSLTWPSVSLVSIPSFLLCTVASLWMEFPCYLHKPFSLYLTPLIKRPRIGNTSPRPLPTYGRMTSISRSRQLGKVRWRQVSIASFSGLPWYLRRRGWGCLQCLTFVRASGREVDYLLVVNQCPALSHRENRQEWLLTISSNKPCAYMGWPNFPLYHYGYSALILSKLGYYIFILALETYQNTLQQNKILPMAQDESLE